MPLPRSLGELQFTAKRHFGRSGPCKMYHHGVTPLTQPQHMSHLKGGDVVVVAADGSVVDEEPTISTHMAHYVKHAVEAKAPPPSRAQVGEPLPFEGVTSYTVDYVEHPLDMRKPAKPPTGGWDVGRREEATPKSTYTVHYPWRDVTPRRPPARQPGTLDQHGAAFEGVSSYKLDYIKHQARPRSAVQPPKTRPVEESEPFQGVTTYTTDYQKFDVVRTGPGPNHADSLRTDPAPFEGASEYRREYIPREHERRPWVHLEPELRNARHRARTAKSSGGRY